MMDAFGLRPRRPVAAVSSDAELATTPYRPSAASAECATVLHQDDPRPDAQADHYDGDRNDDGAD